MTHDGKLHSGEQPLHGFMLVVAAVFTSLANFIAVLDMTIANVSVSTISGALGITNSQGTWVITSYAVAEAITVPLTGWLSDRFGTVRVFVISVAAFGLASALCGMSHSLGFLLGARILQGLAGGPIMPLSQTLLLKIFPKEKAAGATAIWGVTTLVAPVLGPVLGGYICDNTAWEWIFFINVPIAIVVAWVAGQMLRRYESPLKKNRIDVVGLILLIIWVGSLQIMLDEGKDLDWFSSSFIITLAIIAAIGFIAFLIWETTEEHPIVDLRVFRHRGYTMCVVSQSITFGAMFGVNVLNPLWLQSFMGYTSTMSGLTVAWMGVLAVVCAPLAAKLISWIDARAVISFAAAWMGGVIAWRSTGTTDMTYWQISMQLLAMGAGLSLFFIPLLTVALGNVDDNEVASAAGLLNFTRTLSGAFATSLTVTKWEDGIKYSYAELAEKLDKMGDISRSMLEPGMTLETMRSYLAHLTESQAVMLATNNLLTVMAGIFVIGAIIIWLSPRPTKVVDTSAVH